MFPLHDPSQNMFGRYMLLEKSFAGGGTYKSNVISKDLYRVLLAYDIHKK